MANAGGLSVSEWVQNLQNYYWTREEVEEKLERLMVKAFGSVYEMSKGDMKMSAHIYAISKVGEAMRG